MKKIISIIMCGMLLIFSLAGCQEEKKTKDSWLEKAELTKEESLEDLYNKAKKEDTLIVYSVSTRITQTKKAFEAAYPGLTVEIRDLRSPDLIEAVEKNYNDKKSECDLVICNDDSGDFKAKLIDNGIVVGYLSGDIKSKLKSQDNNGTVPFVDEAVLVFYNTNKYKSSPITNIWEMTESQYKNRIYVPSPLRSFSTYVFCTSFMDQEDKLKESYIRYFGAAKEGQESYARLFWEMIAANAVFTNSSDEVSEALNMGEADLGIMVSSKLRLQSVGYNIDAIYKLEPFAGVKTSYSVMLAYGSKNVSTAKLFTRFLFGGADGRGEGYKPFQTLGTWSTRTDVADGNPVPLSDIDIISVNQDYILKTKSDMNKYWSDYLIKANSEK